MRHGMRRRGFTLIELLVVIAIIAILAAILFPVFARARAKAHATTCVSNLKQIAMAIRMYADNNDGYGPYNACPLETGWWAARLQAEDTSGRATSAMFSCRGGNGAYNMNYYRGGHCGSGPANSAPWNMDLGVKNPDCVVLVGDNRGTNSGGRADTFYDIAGDGLLTPAHVGVSNEAFIDGHVKGVKPGWLKSEYDNADPVTGVGNWFWWYM